MRLVAVADVPGVDLRLQLVAPCQQCPILGAKLVHDGGKPGPESVRANSSARKRAGFDEIRQYRFDLQAVKFPPIRHLFTSSSWVAATYGPCSG
jgi:hypothetical protein